MTERKSEILHSEPVKEIMGSPPGNLVAWGTTVLFIVFILFFLGAWFIRYPDVILAQIEITTVNPPISLTSRIDGRILELLPAEKDTVNKGEIIGVMETSALYGSVIALESFIKTQREYISTHPDSFPESTDLGELQQSYSEFMVAYSRHYFTKTNDYLGHRIDALNEEINATEKYIARLGSQEKLLGKSFSLEIARFERDSILFRQKLLSAADFEKSQQGLITKRMELQATGLEIMTQTINLSKKRQELQDVSIQRQEEFLQLGAESSALMADLLSGIDQWKTRYLLVSPVRGVVTFTKIWTRDQFVAENEPVVTIVPENQGDYIGRVSLGMQKSGKVKPGMNVNVKLSSFPYLEYGMLRGIVKSRSLVPEGDSYYVEISFPDGLVTLYGTQLAFSQNMRGTAEIMTDTLNLLQKVIDPLKYHITKYGKRGNDYLPE